MYVCGITPYDATHLGHAATYLAFDLVNRVWRDAGHDVHLVQNVTDIDDPLLERATRDHEDWVVLGMRETALFREDMTALRVLPPRDYIGAVESIPEAVELIEKLLASGAAYRLEDSTGDIYFDVQAAPRFGSESGLDETGHARPASPSAAAIRIDRASVIGSIRTSGAAPARASRPGSPPWVLAGRVGTSSARRSPSTGSG
ncbi:MAG: hypothetical protein WKF78_00425 [Candidatus Limnocylindrales bacterium]